MIINPRIRNQWLLILAISLLLSGCEADPAPQGFAGLGSAAEGFQAISPETLIAYPDALEAHPDHRIEWWYITANLEDPQGTPLGIQWTLFRQALTPGPQRDSWANQQLWLGHAAITREHQHLSTETYARGGVGQAGVTQEPFEAWIDHWRLYATREDATEFILELQTPEFGYQLQLQKTGPAVLQGDQGFSIKSAQGQASHYISLPFMHASGEVRIGDKQLEVQGQAWLDREWSSQPLSPDQQGWDWFSLHLDRGDKLMLFRLRHDRGEDYYSGTYIDAQGNPHPLQPQQIHMQPTGQHSVAGRQLPVEWQLSVADWDIQIQTQALNPDAWMQTGIAYWEGPIRFSGSHSGVGYLEMTGY